VLQIFEAPPVSWTGGVFVFGLVFAPVGIRRRIETLGGAGFRKIGDLASVADGSDGLRVPNGI